MNPGDVLAGRYTVVRELGRGGMGMVVLAHDRDLDRDVAVKAMHPEFAKDESLVARFRREGLALARLRHPSIVRVYDILEPTDGALYLVMEFVPGESLDRVLARGPLSWPDCVRTGVQVCEALGAAHAAGVVHRDVKPGNVLLEPDGMVRVTDLGLAQLAGLAGATRTGQFIGTPEYWAPEQALGKELTPATDQYSCAVMLFEASTGQRPFASDGSPGAVAFMHVMSPVPDPRILVPSMPDAAAEALLRGMAKEPADRYPSVGHFAAALRASLTNAPEEIERHAIGTQAFAAREGAAPVPTRTAEAMAIAGTSPYSPPPVGVDLTRPSEMPPPPRPAPSPSRRGMIFASGGAILVAAALGLLAGRGSTETVDAAHAAGDALTLAVPQGWVRSAVAPAVPGLVLARPVALVPRSGANGVVVVAGISNGEGPSLLPADLRNLTSGVPRALAVALSSSVRALRYEGLSVVGLEGLALRLVVVPTSKGAVTVACAAPPANPALAECDRTAASLQLRGSRALPLRMARAQADALDDALRPLRTTRRSERRAMAAGDAAAIAAAGQGLAAAYGAAAKRVDLVALGPMHLPAQRRLMDALEAAGRGYRDVAAGARARDMERYATARSRVIATERAVEAALAATVTVTPSLVGA